MRTSALSTGDGTVRPITFVALRVCSRARLLINTHPTKHRSITRSAELEYLHQPCCPCTQRAQNIGSMKVETYSARMNPNTNFLLGLVLEYA